MKGAGFSQHFHRLFPPRLYPAMDFMGRGSRGSPGPGHLGGSEVHCGGARTARLPARRPAAVEEQRVGETREPLLVPLFRKAWDTIGTCGFFMGFIADLDDSEVGAYIKQKKTMVYR